MPLPFIQAAYLGEQPVAIGEKMPMPQPTNVSPWVRPTEWLPLDSIATGTQKFIGLLAIPEDDYNYVTVAARGAYTVDWGDGTIENGTDNVQKDHLYDFNSLPSSIDIGGTVYSTLTADGKKQVIVTIIPQAGQNLTVLDFQRRHASLPTSSVVHWLDMRIGSSALTSLIVGASAIGVRMSSLEQVVITEHAMNNLSYVFAYCYSLRSVPLFDTSGVLTFAGMFTSCFSIQEVPNFDTSSVSGFGLVSMFENCKSLQAVPALNTVNCTRLTNTFYSCNVLREIPWMDTRNITYWTTTFYQCYKIKTVPVMDFSAAIYMDGTFCNCGSLTVLPPITAPNITTLSSCFTGCTCLRRIWMSSTENVTNFNSTFYGCYVLEDVNFLNVTSKVTAMTYLFYNCANLRSVPQMHLGTATSLIGFYYGCASLTTIPEFLDSTINITTTEGMFQNCYSVTSVPYMDLTNNLSMKSMFQYCFILRSIPDYVSAKVTDMTNAFYGCYSLRELPTTLTTGACTLFTTFLANCSSLQFLPDFDYSKGTSFAGAFQGCTVLESVVGDLRLCNTTTNLFTSSVAFNKIILNNIKYGFTLASGNKLTKTDLESLFTGLGTATGTQTVALTSAMGVGTAYSKTGCNASQASTSLTVGNNTSLAIGMYATGTGVSTTAQVNFTDAGNLVTTTYGTHNIPEGTPVSFATIVTTTGISPYTTYYVVNPSGANLQVALVPGGDPIELVTNGSGTMLIGDCYISNINGTTITLSKPTVAAISNGSVSFRALNTSIATLKGWTITY